MSHTLIFPRIFVSNMVILRLLLTRWTTLFRHLPKCSYFEVKIITDCL
jgi:hypothetical protein